MIFDLVVAYEIDDSAQVIVERRPNGTEVRYPFDSAIVGSTRPCAVRSVLKGWAADLSSVSPVDHIVAFSSNRAITVTIPTIGPPTLAAIRQLAALGFTDPNRLGFGLLAAGVTDRGVRVFALSDGRAAEITELVAPTQAATAVKAPAATVEELLDREYAALNGQDSEAL